VHILKVQGQYLQANATGGQGTANCLRKLSLALLTLFFQGIYKKTPSHSGVLITNMYKPALLKYAPE